MFKNTSCHERANIFFKGGPNLAFLTRRNAKMPGYSGWAKCLLKVACTPKLLRPGFANSKSQSGDGSSHNFLAACVNPDINYIFEILASRAIDWYINESILGRGIIWFWAVLKIFEVFRTLLGYFHEILNIFSSAQARSIGTLVEWFD